MPYRAAGAFAEGLHNFRARGMVFHGLRIGLRIRKHQPVRGSHGDTRAACGNVARPSFYRDNFFRFFGRDRTQLRGICLRDARYGDELFKSRTDVVALQSTVREEIHGEQHAQQQHEKSQREFCEKITPHVSRTDSPPREPSSDEADSRDPVRFSLAAGARKHPHCAASQSGLFPTRRRATDRG